MRSTLSTFPSFLGPTLPTIKPSVSVMKRSRNDYIIGSFYLIQLITLALHAAIESGDQSLGVIVQPWTSTILTIIPPVFVSVILFLTTAILCFKTNQILKIVNFISLLVYVSILYNNEHASFDVRLLVIFWTNLFILVVPSPKDDQFLEKFNTFLYYGLLQVFTFYCLSGFWKVNLLLKTLNGSDSPLLCSTRLAEQNGMIAKTLTNTFESFPSIDYGFFIFLAILQILLPFSLLKPKGLPFILLGIVSFHYLNNLVLGFTFVYHYLPIVYLILMYQLLNKSVSDSRSDQVTL